MKASAVSVSKTLSKSTESGHVSRSSKSLNKSVKETSAESVSSSSYIYAQSDAKKKLVELNDRLATYIEKVKNLETQNAELVLKYRELEVEQQKFENYQVDYKHQNDDLRRQIESENAARVRADFEKKKMEAEIADLRIQNEKNGRDLSFVQDDGKKLEAAFTDITTIWEGVDNKYRKVEDELNILKGNLVVTLRQNDVLKVELEKATFVRTDLQDRIESELGTYDRLLESEESRLHISKEGRLSANSSRANSSRGDNSNIY